MKLRFGILFLAGLKLAVQRKDFFLIYGLPLAIASMHVSWGAGFLCSIIFEKWNS